MNISIKYLDMFFRLRTKNFLREEIDFLYIDETNKWYGLLDMLQLSDQKFCTMFYILDENTKLLVLKLLGNITF